MECEICHQTIDLCRLVDSDSDEIPTEEPPELIVPDDVELICQKCYHKARIYQLYKLEEAKDQIQLLQQQIQ